MSVWNHVGSVRKSMMGQFLWIYNQCVTRTKEKDEEGRRSVLIQKLQSFKWLIAFSVIL